MIQTVYSAPLLSIRTRLARFGTRITAVFIAAIFAGMIAAATEARLWFTPTNTGSTVNTGTGKHSARKQIGSIIIKVTPTGFEPSEVSCGKGTYLIGIYNRSGLKEIDLQLDREEGNRLHKVKVSREKLDWKGFAELTPGKYILSEANHPEWSCQINVSAQ